MAKPALSEESQSNPSASKMLEPAEAKLVASPDRSRIRVFMMDLWAIVPYYDAYLCQALKSTPASVTLGSITYYLDPPCFAARGIRNDPGLLDVVGRFKLRGAIRPLLKLLENSINTLALMLRFLFSRPTIIHVQYLPLLQWGIPLDFWLLRYCRWLGAGLICTVHDILPSDTGTKHKPTFQKLYAMMDALICHSEPVKQQLVEAFGIAAENISVIPHGPFFYDFPQPAAGDARKKLQVEENQCLVLWQGIIRPYKGVEFLLDAWQRVQQAGAKARLLIAGTGDPALLAAIRDKVRALSLEDSVTLHFEFVSADQMLSYYQAADVVVYPYKAVTTSGALMTGVTQGKAIIATRLGPFQELLQDNKNALLCTYGETEELAAALLRLIDDPALRNTLAQGAASLNLGSEMWKQIATQTMACYAEVVARKSRPHPQMHSNPL